MKLYDLFETYLKNCNLANNTYKCVENYIEKIYKAYFRNIEITEITTNDINRFIRFEKATMIKDVTIYTYFKQLKTIFNYAIKNELLEKNPCANAQIKSVIYVKRNLDYSKRYIKQLLKLFKNHALYSLILLDIHTRNEKM